MPTIIPIRDLRDTGKLSELCNETNEPIFVTKNGYGDMVIMSMAVYEQQLSKLNMREKILFGKTQADSGYTVDGPSAIEDIRKRHAIQI